MTYDRFLIIVITFGLVSLGFTIGGAVYDHPATPVSVGTNGPLTVAEDLKSLTPTFPTVPQQRLVQAQLAACTDLESGQSYSATFAAVGERYGITGQPRQFLVTSAVDTFCFDQSSKITAWSKGNG